MTDYREVQDYLFGLKAKGVKFGIDRMRGLARELGHPERQLPIIHVAGTNGKGSTSAMLDAILRRAGYRVGLYSSPHLVRLGERVQVDRVELTESEIVAYTAELKPIAAALAVDDASDHPSFFEFVTAMAFLQFQRQNCDVGIVEVGLGGELDATNVVQPAVTAITSIGYDHCEILGYSLPEIAQAKAGIIKAQAPVVMGRLPADAERVVRARALAVGAPLFSVRERFGEELTNYPAPAMSGDCQRWNAGTAALVIEALNWGISDRTIQDGLRSAHWPARWQHIPWEGRDVILDASHNPEGAVELTQNLRRLKAQLQRPMTIVVGALGVARAGPLISAVAEFADRLFLVVPDQARACSHAQLSHLVPSTFQGMLRYETVADLFGQKKILTGTQIGDTIVVTGSIYLAGEAMAALSPIALKIESHLQDF